MAARDANRSGGARRSRRSLAAARNQALNDMPSVRADLPQSDYERAIRAHREKTPICMEGDLDRIGQRWRLLNARVVDVIRDEDPAGDSA